MDLLEIYETAKSDVKSANGRPYVAARFKQAVERGFSEGTLVPTVAQMVRKRTDGYDLLVAAGRPDLLVETLLLDTNRSYHHLFSSATIAQARDRLAAFYSAQGGSRAERSADRHDAPGIPGPSPNGGWLP